jgi:hypothetical protein
LQCSLQCRAHVAKMMSNPQKIVPRGPSVDS